MRLADYVWTFLAERGAQDVFLVTGGNAMHLDDALGLEIRLRIICVHHEQTAAMAAEGYARANGDPGVLCVTSGPGAINALGGLYGAFVDSLPVICIAGQSKRELLRTSRDPEHVVGLRQLGVQEADAVAMAQPVTKYAATVAEPFMIRYEMEKAWYLATSGRPGPAFLDIPLDVQAAEIDPEILPGYTPQPFKIRSMGPRCAAVAARLRLAKRPLLLGGEGVREGKAVKEFQQLAERLGIPVVTAWMPDLYPPDQCHYAGRVGSLGTRAGNFALQNADFILAIGSRLSVPQVSFNWEQFAPRGYVVSVNIDSAELAKPIMVVDETVRAEPQLFLETLLSEWGNDTTTSAGWGEWLDWCRARVARYPEVTDAMRVSSPSGIHPYWFVEELFNQLENDAFVACGNALAACVPFQAAPLRLGQRLTSNASAGAMGHDLPSAIGSAVARKGGRVICLAGDGSLMMNLQELQTLVYCRLPIGIFVMNNGGYLSIRTTQKNFFGRYIGESPENGVSFPDFCAVALAFGLPVFRLEGEGYKTVLAEALATDGPWVCDVRLDPDRGFEPCLSSKILPDGRMVSAPLDDMYPFLTEAERASNRL
ncbi:MAG: thiamine pyrophosphate-binding protein [Desulfuromonadales bacterium]